MSWIDLRDAVFLVAGGLIGLATALFFLRGVSDVSVVTAAVGVLILGGQLALGYRQTQGEEEGRRHELRIRNEDLFAQHSREIARLTLLPLMDAWVGESPDCKIMVKVPDREGATGPVEALWNWRFGLEHIKSSSTLEKPWGHVQGSRVWYEGAALRWQTRFLSRLAELVSAAYGPDFQPGDPFNPEFSTRGYNVQGFRNLTRQDPRVFEGWAFAVQSGSHPVKVVSVSSNWHLVYSPEIGEPDIAKVKAIARELTFDAELTGVRTEERDWFEKTDKALKDLAPILRSEVPKVELSGRLEGECAICRDLVPRISRQT